MWVERQGVASNALVPLLIVPTTIALPSTSIDGLVAKSTLGLLSTRGRQWCGCGIAVTDSSSIYRRGRHFRRRQVGSRQRARAREGVRTGCLTTSHKVAPSDTKWPPETGQLCTRSWVEYASSRSGVGWWDRGMLGRRRLEVNLLMG